MPDSINLLLQSEEKYNDYEYPRVTVVMPTYNSSQAISTTLKSVLEQDYPDFEVLVVDAGSTDHTLKIVKGLQNERIRLFTVSEYQRYEMLNKGISHSTGEYLNFLFPGDFYIYRETLKFMMNMALDHERPDLVFCGTLLRDGKSEAKILYRHLTLKLLRQGQQPTSLQSCWFKKETFAKIGRFDPQYTLRGGFDLLCRYGQHGQLRSMSKNRIFIDYDLRWVTRQSIIQHFKETFKIIYKYFGSLAVLRWLYYQKDTARLFKLWSKSLKSAFLGGR